MTDRQNFLQQTQMSPSLPFLQAIGCHLGFALAGFTGAIAGLFSGALTHSLLDETNSLPNKYLTPEDIFATDFETLMSDIPAEEISSASIDLQACLRETAKEALIDLGGKTCFPEQSKKRGRQSGRIMRSMPPRPTFPAGQNLVEQNDLFCSYLKNLYDGIDKNLYFSPQKILSSDSSPSPTLFFQKDYPNKLTGLFSKQTYADLASSLFEEVFLPILQERDPDPGSLWDFKTNIEQALLDRFLWNLNPQLRTHVFAWQAFNRLLLSSFRRYIQMQSEPAENILLPLNTLLEAPDPSLMGSWSEELASLLAACPGDNQRSEKSIKALSESVLAHNGSTRVYLYGLLGLVERTESVIDRAESIFRTRLSSKQQDLARRIFIRLTEPGDGCPDTARRAQVNELYPSLEDTPSVESVLKIMAEAGMVRLVRHMVEPSSDTLIQKWPTLRQWLDEDRHGLRLLHQLANAARSWHDSRKNEDNLLRGAQLLEIEEWVKSHPGITNPSERELLIASRQQADLTQAKTEPQLRTELENSRRLVETEHQRAESYRMQAEAERQRAEALHSSSGRLRAITRLMVILILLVLAASLLIFSAWSSANQELSNQATQALFQLTRAAQGLWQAETAQAASTLANFERVTALAENTRIARQKDEAQNQAKASNSILLAAQSQRLIGRQPDLSLLLAIEANNRLDNFETRTSLIESLQSVPYIARILGGHTASITSVAYSPDGRLVASGAENGEIRVWQAGNGQPFGDPIKGQASPVKGIAFSPDGKDLASAVGDRNIYLWNLETRNSTVIPIPDMISAGCVSFSPDGKLLFVAGESRNNVAVMLDPTSGKTIGAPFLGHTGKVESVSFSPDGQFIATGGWDRTVIIWDKNTQRPILPPFKGPDDRITSLAFSPEGNTIAASSADRTIYFWNVFTGREAFRFEDAHTSQVTGIMFSADGKSLASAGLDGNIWIWNLISRQKSSTPLTGHIGEINTLAFHPNGVLLASGGQDQKTLQWDLRADQQLTRATSNGTEIKKAVISPDGRLVAEVECSRLDKNICQQDEVRFWLVSANSLSLLPGRQPLRDYRQIYGLQFSPDGSLLAVAGCQSDAPATSSCYSHGIRLYQTLTGLQVGVPLEGHTDVISAISFSPDGRILVTGSRDRSIRVWDGTSGTFSGQVLRSHTSGITALEFSPDGKRLFSASLDRTIRVWDTSTWLPASQPLRGHTDSVYSLSFPLNSKFFYSASSDRQIIQWDSTTLKPQISIPSGHQGVISNLAVQSGLNMLLSTGNDRTLRFTSLIDQREMGNPMLAHTSLINSLNISSDGATAITASRDSLRIWDLNPKAWQAKACQIAGRNLTLNEWNMYLKGEIYQKTCSTWPEGK